MALSQLVSVNPGDRIQSVTWNNEIQNILTNPIALISPSTGAINFALQAHSNLLVSALSASSGTAGQVLTVSTGLAPIWGSAVGGTNVGKNTIVFTATSTTYTPSTGVGSVYVQIWGAGGGGSGANGASNSGGAGGSGGYAARMYAVTTSMTVSITIGIGGTGGTVTGSSGVTGGTSVFNSSVNALTVTGGGGGGVLSTGGIGGATGGGTIGFSGWTGENGDNSAGAGTRGANSYGGVGQGGYAGRQGSVNGGAAQGYGAGGGGAYLNGAGGSGANGVCIVTEYA